jgi:DNA topoisomerase-1
MSRRSVKGVGTNAQRIYEMIWRRTVASQMIDATGTTTTVSFAVTAAGAGEQCVFTASGTVIDVPGFRLVYVPQTEEEPPMPAFTVGQPCTADQFTAVAHATRPPARYTEGTLIKALEEEGIGRPSTYTAIMQSLRLRYVWSKKGDPALIPTISAFAVDQVMGICFAELIDYRFTSQMEDRLNDVVAGDLEYENLLAAFWSAGDGTWTPLEKLIVNGKTLFDPKKTPVLSFGTHPTLGEEVVLRAGRAYKSRGRTVGRPYLACGKKTVSIADETELDQLTPDVAFARLLETREPRVLGEHGGHQVEVLRGIYGPYLRWNGRNVKLPKNLDAGTVTLDDVTGLLE